MRNSSYLDRLRSDANHKSAIYLAKFPTYLPVLLFEEVRAFLFRASLATSCRAFQFGSRTLLPFQRRSRRRLLARALYWGCLIENNDKTLAMNLHPCLTPLIAVLLVVGTVSVDEPANDLILVLDVSNSMWGQIDGESYLAGIIAC